MSCVRKIIGDKLPRQLFEGVSPALAIGPQVQNSHQGYLNTESISHCYFFGELKVSELYCIPFSPVMILESVFKRTLNTV